MGRGRFSGRAIAATSVVAIGVVMAAAPRGAAAPATPGPEPGTIRTVAGGPPGSQSATATHVFGWAEGAVVEGDAEYLIVDGVVVRYSLSTGAVTSVAGGNGVPGFSGDGGPAVDAHLNAPRALAIDAAGDLYIADTSNNRVRRVDHGTGEITTVAGTGTQYHSGDGGAATAAALCLPQSLAVNSAGDLFIGETSELNVAPDVRVVDHATGVISTYAGGAYAPDGIGDGGPATNAELLPAGLTVAPTGDLIIADSHSQRVRRVDHATGTISTVAGSGTPMFVPHTSFYVPESSPSQALAVTPNGYYAPAPGGFGGDGGPATQALLDLDGVGVFGAGLAYDTSGDLFIADSGNLRVRRVDPATGLITTVAGSWATDSGDGGPATAAGISTPNAVAVDAAGDLLITSDQGEIGLVRRVDHATGTITTVFGSRSPSASDGDPGVGASLGANDDFHSLAADAAGRVYYSSLWVVRRFDPVSGTLTTVAGGPTSYTPDSGDGGPATSAYLSWISQVVVSPSGNLYIADSYHYDVRKVDHITGIITAVAGTGTSGHTGDGGPARSARLRQPTGVALDASGNLYIFDSGHVRRVDHATGIISNYAGVDPGSATYGKAGDGGPATAATLPASSQLAVDPSGGVLLIDGAVIRRIDPLTGIITRIAGNGSSTESGDGGPAIAAGFSSIGIWSHNLTVDRRGDIDVAESDRVRRVDALTGVVTTVAGGGEPTDLLGDGGPATGAHLAARGVTVDPAGNLYIDDLASGYFNARLRVVAAGVAPTAPTPHQALVDAWFHDFVGRLPTAPEITTSSAILDAGTSSPAAFERAIAEGRWQTFAIDDLYEHILGRGPSPSVLASRSAAIMAHRTTLENTAEALYASPEYVRRAGGTNAAWIKSLYARILGSNPTADRIAHWSAVATAYGRLAVAAAFYSSYGARSRRVLLYYQAMLHRPPDSTARAYWAHRIATAGDIAVREHLATSPAYAALAVTAY